VLACKPACFRPATTLAGLISDIKSSIATYGKQETESFYTDRRYHSSNRQHHNKDSNKGKKCFVCGKSGCWSTNHTKDERDRKIRQYISDFEGDNGDSDDDDNQGDTFMTEFGLVNRYKAFNQLANNSTFHALTGSVKEASNFYFNIEPCSNYHDDPKAEVFWTKFAKEKGK